MYTRIIEMAWEDRTPFEAITLQFGLRESEVIRLMRRCLKRGSFNLWRSRVAGRATKHLKLRSPEVARGYCPTQYKHR
ncbi:TIGR03643 family protein [Marinobacter salicampi]|uniref:TIGR03643 family protein n=1 Tax=Marinobacter salicampi TaxID=435907 RepID=UPI00140B1320|nr:TIGR03643 family protein [Marinobacter salicampi]